MAATCRAMFQMRVEAGLRQIQSQFIVIVLKMNVMFYFYEITLLWNRE